MTFQDLLQGVLSGKFAVPQGALGSPQRPQIADMEAVRDLSRQNIAMTGQQPPVMSSGPMSGVLQPAPPPGSGPTLGPGLPPQGPPQGALAPAAGPGRDPGMAGALAPTGGPGIPQSAQVGSAPPVGYGRAPDSIGNGRPPMGPGWNPQFDPNQPQASPQPGNGVLALDNATAMARANPMGPNQPPAPPGPVDQGPTPMALQSTDESTPVPQAKPATKAGDSVTRAKGILAAATSGNPDAFQAALTNPSAAAQVGSQTPDSAWNERSSYDGQVSATTPDGKPIPLADQHAEDKQKTFGQKFMGALADPDTQDLLQSIGIGLLSNPNAMKGMAEGMQMYQQLHLRRQQRDLEQKHLDIENKRADTADKRAQTQLDQGQQQIELSKGDQALRRDQNAQVAKQQALQFGLEQARQDELGRHDRAEEYTSGLSARTSALTAQVALQRLRQGGDTPYNFGDTYYDSEHNTLQQRRNQATGAVEYVDSSTGQVVQNPKGLVRAQDDILKTINNQEGKLVGSTIDAGVQAHQQAQPLKMARDLINANPDLYMGDGANSVQAWRKMLVSSGLASEDTVKNAGTTEELQSLSGNAVAALAHQWKGSISNYEDQKFSDWAFGAGKTRVGNLGLLEMSIRGMERQDEKGQFFADHDNLPYRNVSKMWRDYEDKNPVFAGMPGFGATEAQQKGSGLVDPNGRITADGAALIAKYLKTQ